MQVGLHDTIAHRDTLNSGGLLDNTPVACTERARCFCLSLRDDRTAATQLGPGQPEKGWEDDEIIEIRTSMFDSGVMVPVIQAFCSQQPNPSPVTAQEAGQMAVDTLIALMIHEASHAVKDVPLPGLDANTQEACRDSLNAYPDEIEFWCGLIELLSETGGSPGLVGCLSKLKDQRQGLSDDSKRIWEGR